MRIPELQHRHRAVRRLRPVADALRTVAGPPTDQRSPRLPSNSRWSTCRLNPSPVDRFAFENEGKRDVSPRCSVGSRLLEHETKGALRPQPRQHRLRRSSENREYGISARHRMVGAEHDGRAVGRDLNCAAHHGCGRTTVVSRARERRSFEPYADPIAARRYEPSRPSELGEQLGRHAPGVRSRLNAKHRGLGGIDDRRHGRGALRVGPAGPIDSTSPARTPRPEKPPHARQRSVGSRAENGTTAKPPATAR